VKALNSMRSTIQGPQLHGDHQDKAPYRDVVDVDRRIATKRRIDHGAGVSEFTAE